MVGRTCCQVNRLVQSEPGSHGATAATNHLSLSRKRSGSCRTDIAASAGNGKRRAPNAFLSPPTGGKLFYVLLSNHSGFGFSAGDLFAPPFHGICAVGIVLKAAIPLWANSPSTRK